MLGVLLSTLSELLDEPLNPVHLEREDVYKHFRFTCRASWISLTASRVGTNNTILLRWKWTGKRRGESLLLIPHKQPTRQKNSIDH
ncbi:hypothetical protein BGW80DRAFT_1287653 [Lactifluus volemus]|nr:hypothetical protein BGW80DRAFT_1287653 [Lactifluus volemus]